VFGYTLRSELVYRLKRSLEQIADFELEAPLQHLLVDEYQDLNQCDLAIIKALAGLGLELFVAGDDDQSIYGFRKAHPAGIRSFLDEYPGSVNLAVQVCKRCDTEILNLAEFVASLDPDRLEKGTRPEPGRAPGEVALLAFHDQYQEARAVASLCRELINIDGYAPSDILILSRVNTRNAFSNVLDDAFADLGLPFSCDISAHPPLDMPSGRIALSALRLLRNQSDHLAWRTILRLKRNRIGDTIIGYLVNICRSSGLAFFEVLNQLADNPSLIPRFGRHIIHERDDVARFLEDLRANTDLAALDQVAASALIARVASWSTADPSEQDSIESYILERAAASGFETLDDILIPLEAGSQEIEQEIDPGAVNMLTMHKAKGLTSKAVIVIAAEDEYIPGRQEAEPALGDERRLLFVSLSRAKHKLFITFCNVRQGQQRRLGRSSGSPRRSLTRFLRNAPIRPVDGPEYIRQRIGS